jgi:hypothetical protein
MAGLIAGWAGRSDVLVCVTHQVNITALTGIVPREGEVIVVEASPRRAVLVRLPVA